MGPSIYDVHKIIEFLDRFPCAHGPHEPDPLADVYSIHAVRKNDPISRKFFGFGVPGWQIFYISSVTMMTFLMSCHKNSVFTRRPTSRNLFNSRCGRPHWPDGPDPPPLRVDIINGAYYGGPYIIREFINFVEREWEYS